MTSEPTPAPAPVRWLGEEAVDDKDFERMTKKLALAQAAVRAEEWDAALEALSNAAIFVLGLQGCVIRARQRHERGRMKW